MERLMCTEPTRRLGYNGPHEVKEQPFLADIDWDHVMDTEPQFVPQVSDPESTDYFDPRGAIPQLFHDDELVAVTGRPSPVDSSMDETPSHVSPVREAFSATNDEFGTFSFKNLPVLKQANDELIRKMQASPSSDASSAPSPIIQTLNEPILHMDRRRSVSQRGPRVLVAQSPPPPPPPPAPPPPPIRSPTQVTIGAVSSSSIVLPKFFLTVSLNLGCPVCFSCSFTAKPTITFYFDVIRSVRAIPYSIDPREHEFASPPALGIWPCGAFQA